MNILIAAASWMEVKLLADELLLLENKNKALTEFQHAGNKIAILITGIGTTYATFRLTSILLQHEYQMVLNVGITGSLKRNLTIGEVVNVISEQFADWGIEQKDEFLTLFEADFIGLNDFPFENGMLKATESNGWIPWKEVSGITANKSPGKRSSINEINRKFGADVESTEGAAIFFVSKHLGVPCFEIKAVSNYVEPRDASKWNIPLALMNLKTALLKLLNNISEYQNLPEWYDHTGKINH